jgi:4-amino-4-deoxy-L-arabinose transferase-like glycosyltransferase
MSIESFLHANRRLIAALACYLVLILIALYALLPIRDSHDRMLLGFVLCVFTILILRTIAHAAREKDSE